MSRSILNVIIDERKQIGALETEDLNKQLLMRQAVRFASSYSSKKNIYKDYLLSSEVFYLE